ncbi:MAG: radical SAM protein [Candidatus Omnitrophota bacterium]
MKVFFIFPNVLNKPCIHYGIASIAALLKNNGHQVSLMQVLEIPKKGAIIKNIAASRPDIIAFTSVTSQFSIVKEIAQSIRREFDLPIICGGIHATLAPDEVIADQNIDIICRGEGEYPMLELVSKLRNNLPCDDIKNLWIKRNGIVKKNGIRLPLDNLDKLSFPYIDFFDIEHMLRSEHGRFRVITSRSCPFDCSYCCAPALRRLSGDDNGRVRRLSVDSVLMQMRSWLAKYPIKSFIIDDDAFTVDQEYVAEFCSKYKNAIDVPFACNSRPESLSPGLLKILKSAGCELMLVGVESGSEKLRNDVLNRSISNNRLINCFKQIRAAGIKTFSFNMIGLPGETEDEAEETIRLNQEISPDSLQVSMFCFYPGTKLSKSFKIESQEPYDKIFNYFTCSGRVASAPPFTRLTPEKVDYYMHKLRSLWIEEAIRRRYRYLFLFYRVLIRIIGFKKTVALFLKLAFLKDHVLYWYVWRFKNYFIERKRKGPNI